MKPILRILIFLFLTIYVESAQSEKHLMKRQIYGGWQSSDSHYYPYQVYLRRNGWQRPSWLPTIAHSLPYITNWFVMPFHCGGVIISEYHVLTAAHCILGNPESEVNRIEVVAGSNKRIDSSAVVHKVQSIAVHDQPRFFYDIGDIAVIKVAEPFKFSSKIQPVKLPKHNYVVAPRTPVVVTGWGETEDMYSVDYLHVLVMRVVEIEQCRKSWLKLYRQTVPLHSYLLDFKKLVHDSMICIQGRGGQSICAGDSGGPAVTIDGLLVGIVSFGSRPCGNENKTPDVFTRVAYYIPWIKKHTEPEIEVVQ
ncbi:hypothetical protein TKK_0009289 [Trichogramma kaykai]|uniref:Peptidase S1 domain-containing protein n=1 Tax=Trichogramma kaykai TaxID=54128 RepID=A0ABD2X2G1_9HYME